MSETKEEYIKRHQIKKSPEHMTEHELRTEVISLRAEVNRLKVSIENQPRVTREALRLLECPKCGLLMAKRVICSWCGKRIRIDD